MDIIIAIIVLFVSLGFGIKYRYKIATYINLRDVTPEVDEEEREIELRRDIEDCERKLRRISEAKKASNDNWDPGPTN